MNWISVGKTLPNEGQLVDAWLDSGSGVRVRRARFVNDEFIDTGVGDGVAGVVLRTSSWRAFHACFVFPGKVSKTADLCN